jgi:hypothetical protein
LLPAFFHQPALAEERKVKKRARNPRSGGKFMLIFEHYGIEFTKGFAHPTRTNNFSRSKQIGLAQNFSSLRSPLCLCSALFSLFGSLGRSTQRFAPINY